MKKLKIWSILMLVAMALPLMIACGSDGDSDDNGGGSSGGGGGTSTFSIIGTWRYYFQSNDPSRGQVYNLVTFKSDKTGSLIEEVGYGSDNPNNFTWTQSGNNIRIIFVDGGYSVTWQILQVIDNNTVVVSDGKNQYTVYKDGTQGGGGSGSGGSVEPVSNLTVDKLLGMWQSYRMRFWGLAGGEKYDMSFDVAPMYHPDPDKPDCWRFEFYADYSFKKFDYYEGDWFFHGPYDYKIKDGHIIQYSGNVVERDYAVTKITANELVMVEYEYYAKDEYSYRETSLRRVGDSGGSGGDSGGGSGGGPTAKDTINNAMTVSAIYDVVTAMPKDEVSILPVCAKGKICSIKFPFSTDYGTAVFNISDTGYTDGKEVTVYNAYYKADGQKWKSSDTQIAVGDEVLVYGKVVNYQGKTPEFADKQCYVVSINGK